MAQACQREKRKEAARSQKISKEVVPRAKKMAREVLFIRNIHFNTSFNRGFLMLISLDSFFLFFFFVIDFY